MTAQTFLDGRVTLHCGDCLDVLAAMPEASVDSVVCDPPYHLTSIVKRFGAENAAPAKVGKTGAYARASTGFMGKVWDGGDVAFRVETWAAVMRVLKPGGHLIAFSGTRTYHRMVCAIEDAGFEVRDQIGWAYGSGFPKSHDVSKGIDRARDDYDAICAVAVWLRPHVERVGFGAVTKHFGFKDETMARARWTSRSQPNVPRWEQWIELKALCSFGSEMDAEVWRLNGRKGKPGEAWGQREVIGSVEKGSSPLPSNHAGTWADDQRDGCFDITAPATDSAKQWEGWGTALKPSWEPICLARKPLGTNPIPVRDIVEHELRARGVEGDIVWTARSASGAERRGRSTNSCSTEAPKTVATSVVHVAASATQSGERQIQTVSAENGINGTSGIPGDSVSSENGTTQNLGSKSSPRMAASAPAVAKLSNASSRLTTSTAEEPRTARPSTARSTDSCEDKASRLDTESFAGIATGLTGSQAVAHIKRNKDGTFAWPNDLPICVPSHPLTVAANVLKHGTGAINVDGCRVESGGRDDPNWRRAGRAENVSLGYHGNGSRTEKPESLSESGRWPANLIHDGSEEVLAAFPESISDGGTAPMPNGGGIGTFKEASTRPVFNFGDSGSAARFFYTAKADSEDRLGSKHPTVKPIDLMQWLVRLVTPKGGLVLDPFAGTGTTGEAAWREGMRAVLIEREPEYQADIARRMELAVNPTKRAAVAKTKNNLDRPEDLPLFAEIAP